MLEIFRSLTKLLIYISTLQIEIFRLLEDSMEHATWMLVTGVVNKPDIANLLDFMIRRLKTNKTVHENFRLWIVCEDLNAINLSTAQKCTSHFLGDEISEQHDAEDDKAESKERVEEKAELK